jgi:hypothetical protein
MELGSRDDEINQVYDPETSGNSLLKTKKAGDKERKLKVKQAASCVYSLERPSRDSKRHFKGR